MINSTKKIVYYQKFKNSIPFLARQKKGKISFIDFYHDDVQEDYSVRGIVIADLDCSDENLYPASQELYYNVRCRVKNGVYEFELFDPKNIDGIYPEEFALYNVDGEEFLKEVRDICINHIHSNVFLTRRREDTEGKYKGRSLRIQGVKMFPYDHEILDLKDFHSKKGYEEGFDSYEDYLA